MCALNSNVEVNGNELDGMGSDFFNQDFDKDNEKDLKRTLDHYFVCMDKESDLREQTNDYDDVNSLQGQLVKSRGNARNPNIKVLGNGRTGQEVNGEDNNYMTRFLEIFGNEASSLWKSKNSC